MVGFLGDLKTPKFHYEIKWSLEGPFRKDLSSPCSNMFRRPCYDVVPKQIKTEVKVKTRWKNCIFWQKTLFLIHFVATSYRQKGKKHGLCSHLNPNFLLTDIIFIFFYMLILFPIGFAIVHSRAILDVLCCQQIKLFQVVSTSEFHEYWWKDLENIFLVPTAFCRASEARTQSKP